MTGLILGGLTLVGLSYLVARIITKIIYPELTDQFRKHLRSNGTGEQCPHAFPDGDRFPSPVIHDPFHAPQHITGRQQDHA